MLSFAEYYVIFSVIHPYAAEYEALFIFVYINKKTFLQPRIAG
jgi:hypothetical protein